MTDSAETLRKAAVHQNRSLQAWLGLGARLILGTLLLHAGVAKTLAPFDFADAVAAYRILPASLITLVALILPWLEVLTGACLVLGVLTDASALVSAAMALVFAAAITSALARGLDLSCGCFGAGTEATRLSWLHLALDLGLLVLAWMVARYGPGHLALAGVYPVEPPAHGSSAPPAAPAVEVADRPHPS